jgi:hypothetical protein
MDLTTKHKHDSLSKDHYFFSGGLTPSNKKHQSQFSNNHSESKKK